ncbi:MAG: hypothetical protein K9G58_06545 [Bacteroidales bacterium]|nr:hypothetical protein [Bacteroidales bacterium]MCF8386448.1 hypothetical protein [Bacteroidales bacterium]MCF8397808.1 hypothetical protein [Bacteroidales bacterium]
MIEIYLAIAVYLGLDIWFAIEGSKRKIGALRAFLISFLLTPIVGFIFVFNSEKKFAFFEVHYQCSRCGYEFTEKTLYCPLCEKDGHKVELEEVKKVMT